MLYSLHYCLPMLVGIGSVLLAFLCMNIHHYDVSKGSCYIYLHNTVFPQIETGSKKIGLIYSKGNYYSRVASPRGCYYVEYLKHSRMMMLSKGWCAGLRSCSMISVTLAS